MLNFLAVLILFTKPLVRCCKEKGLCSFMMFYVTYTLGHVDVRHSIIIRCIYIFINTVYIATTTATLSGSFESLDVVRIFLNKGNYVYIGI